MRRILFLSMPLSMFLIVVITMVTAGIAVLMDGGSTNYDSVASPPLPTRVPAAPINPSDPTGAVANFDGSAVATVESDESGPALRVTTSSSTVDFPIDDGFELRAISTDGDQVALVRVGGEPTISEVMIVQTTVADTATGETTTGGHRTFEFDGRIEPEAFSTDGGTLFVVDHQVTNEPGAYRIRPLNLSTGRLETMLGPSKQPLVEDMNGVARRQVWGSDYDRLYTLYIRQTHSHDGGEGHVHASGRPANDGFVHILDLTEEWAFCLDLPPEFGQGDLATTALTVGGDTIMVADATAGQVAFASASERAVTRVVDLTEPLSSDEELHVGLASPDPSVVMMAAGRWAQWYEAATMRPVGDPASLGHNVVGVTSQAGEDAVLVWFPSDQMPQFLRSPSA